MPTATLHLRDRRGGPLCGVRGEAVRVTAIEHYARLSARRCGTCWRALIEYLAACEGRGRA